MIIIINPIVYVTSGRSRHKNFHEIKQIVKAYEELIIYFSLNVYFKEKIKISEIKWLINNKKFESIYFNYAPYYGKKQLKYILNIYHLRNS